MIWLTYMTWRTDRRTKRIEAYLLTRAHKSKVDYIPDDETLNEARRLLDLRERRRAELRDMEEHGNSDLARHDQ